MNFTAGEQSSLTISPTSDSVDFNGTAYTKTVTFSLSGRLSSNSTSNFTYTVDNSSTATSCQISGSTALVRTITAASQGTCVIKVTDPAYGSYLATTRTYTVTFNKSTIATPSAPNLAIRTGISTSIRVTFPAYTGAASYIVRVYDAQTGGHQVGTDWNSFTVSGPNYITGLTPGTTYYVSVLAVAASNYIDSAESSRSALAPTMTSQTITFPTVGSKVYGGLPFTISATTSSGLTVGFTTSSTVCSISGTTVTILHAGDCVVVASQSGDVNYDPASSLTQTITIGKKSATVTATVSPSTAPYGSVAPTYGFSVTGLVGTDHIDTVAIQFTSTGGYNSNAPPSTTDAVDAYTVIPSAAHFDSGDANDYNISYGNVAYSITTAQITKPSAPTVSATTNTVKSINVSWSASTGASSYTLTLYSSGGSTALATITGLTGTSYVITTADYASLANATAYDVTVTAVATGNTYSSSAESNPATVTTLGGPATPTLSTISSVSKTEGQSVTFSVTVSGTGSGTLSYQWYKGTTAISGATSSSLALSNLTSADAGDYKVTVTNTLNGESASATTIPATLSISNALVFSTPTGLSTTIGSLYSLDLSSFVSGGSLIKTYTMTGTLPTGLTRSGASIMGMVTSSVGATALTVTVTDSNGATASQTFTISVAAATLGTPQTVSAVNKLGTLKTILVSWMPVLHANGFIVKLYDSAGTTLLKTITGISGNSYTVDTTDYASLANGTTYQLSVIASGDAVDYSNSAESSKASVTTLDGPTAPTVTIGGMQSRTPGQTLSLTSTVTNYNGLLSYRWLRGTTQVGTSSTLTINSVTSADAGDYTLEVTNTYNGATSVTTSSISTLAVASTLTISNPSNATGTVGSAITAIVPTVSGGKTPLSFALTGTLVSGLSFDTSTGSISGTPTAAGTSSFTITATDANGATVSTSSFSIAISAATLTTPSNVVLSTVTGSNTSLTVSFTGDANATSYLVKVFSNSGRTTQVGSDWTSFTPGATNTITGLTANTSYWVSVQAIGNSNYNSSGISAAATQKTNSVFTVHFDTQGSNTIADRTFTTGVAFGGTDPTPTARSGYTFLGWSTSTDGLTTTPSTYIAYTTGDVTFYAQWVANPTDKSLSVTVNPVGTTTQVTTGAPAVLYLTAGQSFTATVNISAPTGTTLYSKWTSFDGTNWASTNYSSSIGALSTTVSNVTTSMNNYQYQAFVKYGKTAGYSGELASIMLKLSVSQALAINSIGNLVATRGVSYSYTPTRLGGRSGYTFSLDGSLPAGLTFDTTDGSIHGTATAVTSALSRTLTVTDANGASATQTFTIAVAGATLATPTAPTVSATANTLKSIDVSWTAVSNASSYTVKIYDALGTTQLRSINVPSGTSLTVTATNFPSIADNTGYNFTVFARGDGSNYLDSLESTKVSVTTNAAAATPSVTITGSQSRTPGQSLTLNSTVTGTGSGTLTYKWFRGTTQVATTANLSINAVTSADAGDYTVEVTNSLNGSTAVATSSASTLTVDAVLAGGSPTGGLTAHVGDAYSLDVSTGFTGGKSPLTYAITSGTLPGTLSLSGSTISGTPTATGTYAITITATDANGATITSSFTITVAAATVLAPTVGNLTNLNKTVGQTAVFSTTGTTTDGGTISYQWQKNGVDIAGETGSSLTISVGAGLVGTNTYKVIVTNTRFGQTATTDKTATLTVASALAITSPSATTGHVGVALSVTTGATGGATPLTYSLTGTLIAGLTFDTTDGSISGTPTATGNVDYTVTATDANAATVTTSTFNITVLARVQLAQPTTFTLTRYSYGDYRIQVYFSAVTNASSYIVRVYDAATGGNLVQTITNFSAGINNVVSGLSAATDYWFTIEAVGANEYDNSIETTRAQMKTALRLNTITFGALSNKTYGDADFTLSGTSTSGLAVTYSTVGTGGCTVSGNTVHLSYAGSCTIRANQAGDTTWSPATSVDQSFSIAKAALIITGSTISKIYRGTSGTLWTHSTLVTGDAIDNVVVRYVGTGTTTYLSSTTAPTAVGTYAIVLSAATGLQAASAITLANNYDITYVDGTLTITQLKLTTPALRALNKVTGSNTSLAVQLNTDSDATSYVVKVYSDVGLNTLVSTWNSFTPAADGLINGLTANTRYWVTVQSIGSGNFSSSDVSAALDESTNSSWTLTWNSQGGSSVADGTFSTGSAITPPSDPTYSGYTFVGWYESATTGTKINFGTYAPTATANLTLYAHWVATPNSRQVDVSLTFGGTYGTAPNSSTATLNLTATEGATLTVHYTAPTGSTRGVTWWKKASGSSTWTQVNSTVSLTLTNVAASADGDQYRAEITNTLDGVTSPVYYSTAFTLAVAPAFSIDAISNQSATVGSPFSMTATVTGGLSPYTYSLYGGSTLPAGLTLNTSTGVISGTPTAAGTSAVRIRAVDSNGASSTSSSFNIVVAAGAQAALVFTMSPNTANFNGTGYSATLTLSATGGSGSGTVSYSVANGTAQGCSLSNSVLTATSAGTCVITATKAADSDYTGATATQTFTFGTLALSSVAKPALTQTLNTALSLVASWIAVSNASSYTVKLYKSTDTNTALATFAGLSGTSLTINTANYSGLNSTDSYVVTVTAVGNTNDTVTAAASVASDATQALPVAVAPTVSGKTASTTELLNLGQAVSWNYTATATDNGVLTYKWQKDGVDISGATSATYGFTVSNINETGTYKVIVTNTKNGTTATAEYTVVFTAQAILATPTNVTATTTTGQVMSVTVDWTVVANAASYDVYIYDSQNALICTFTTTSNRAALSDANCPAFAATSPQTYSVKVRANAAAGQDAYRYSATSGAVSVTTNPFASTPVITTQPIDVYATVGQTATMSVVATGDGTLSYRWKYNNTVNPPSNTTSSLTVTAISGTGLGSDGSTFKVIVYNSLNNDAKYVTSNTVTLHVAAQPTITGATFSTAVGASVNKALVTSTCGTSSCTYDIASGSLPAGLSLDTTDGHLTGAATTAGTYIYVIRVTDGNGFQVSSASKTITVTAGTQAAISLSVSPTSQSLTNNFSASITVGVTGGNGTGAVTYSIDSTGTTATGCALDSATNPTTLTASSAGICVIKATKAGDSNFSNTVTATVNFTIGTKSATIASGTYTKVFGGSTPSMVPTASGLLTGDAVSSATLTYEGTGSTSYTASTTMPTAAGTYSVTPSVVVLSTGSTANYNFTYVSGTLTISATTQTISFPTISGKTYGGGTFTASATATSGLTVTIASTTTAVCTVSGTTVTIVKAGTCTLTADQAGNGNYDAATQVTQSITISKAVLTATASSHTVAFGASAPSVTVTYSNFANGDNATSTSFTTGLVAPTCSTTYTSAATAGSTEATTCSGGSSTNYTFSFVDGTITVGQAQLATPNSLTYSSTDSRGLKKTVAFLWNATANASSYTLKLYNSAGTSLLATVTGLTTTSYAFTTADFANLADNTSYKATLTAIGGSNFADSAESAKETGRTMQVYAITFNANGADSGSVPADQEVIEGALGPIVANNTGNLTKLGYTMTGWNTQAGLAGNTYTFGTRYTVFVAATLYANWVANSLMVTYKSNGGGQSDRTQNFTAGTAFSLTANNFTRTGYTFAGWSNTNNGSRDFTDVQSVTLLIAKTLYALWTPVDYTVTYALNGGGGTAPTETVKHIGDSFTIPADPSRTGYTFNGWTDGTTIFHAGDSYSVGSQNITLTAQWTVETYVITYSHNTGASGSASRTSDSLIYGAQPITLPSVGTMTKLGHTFVGWSLTANGSVLTGNYTATATRTLYAIWTPNVYVITYNSNGADSGAPSRLTDNYTYNSAALTLPTIGTMVKDGYSFGGWTTTVNDSTTLVAAAYTGAADQVLYALWTAISYRVTYDVSVGTSSTPTEGNHHIGETFTLAAGPTPPPTGTPGVTLAFAGWDDGISQYPAGATYTMLASDVTFVAKYVYVYMVHYILNGSPDQPQLDVQRVNGYQGITAPAPERLGYTFRNWVDQAGATYAPFHAFTVDADTYILTAQWDAIPIHVTYDVAGGTASPLPTESNHIIGDSFTVKAAPTKTGYVFAGWQAAGQTYGAGASFTVGADDIAFTAIWTPIVYRVTYDLNRGTSATPVQANRNYQQTFIVAPAPTRRGYTFVKWNDGTTDYNPGATYTVGSSNVILTAQWTLTSLTVTYNNGAGNANPGPTSTLATEANHVIGDTFALAAEPVWPTHDFLGWSDGASIYAAGSTYLMLGENVTLTAAWANTQYALTFDAGGAQGAPPVAQNLAVGATIVLPDAGSMGLAGYTFAGWSTGITVYRAGASFSMPASAVQLTAMWDIIVTQPTSTSNSGPSIIAKRIPTGLNFGTSTQLLQAVSSIGSPVTWSTKSSACQISANGTLTVTGAGQCQVTATDSVNPAITSTYIIPVAPKLDLSLLAVTNLQATSATLNAQVAWPGANFSVKFCITDSPLSKNCVVTSTISISNENSNGTSANNAVSIARDISGLLANTQYFVHAAVIVGDDQFTTATALLRTPITAAPSFGPVKKGIAKFSWIELVDGSMATILVDGKVVCKNASGACLSRLLVGPKSLAQVVFTNKDGETSLPINLNYSRSRWALPIATIKFAPKRQALSPSQRRLVNSVALKVNALGFASITVASPTMKPVKNYIEAKRIGAVYEFLKRYFKNEKKVKVTLIRARTKASLKQTGKDVPVKQRSVVIAVR
jgi:uncharacterized repeat protein (TIGR02543 family)